MDRRELGRRTVLAATGALAFPVFTRAAERKPKVAIQTRVGMIVVELEAARAPITSANFLRYVDNDRYDGGSFYRSVRTPGAPEDGQIVGGQGPKSRPYPPIAHESTTITGLRHLAGTISLGRFAPGSATSNFFICTSAEPYLDAHPGAPGDNKGYAAFGQVVEGMDVVRKIHAMPTNGRSAYADQKGQWLTHPVPILHMKRV